MEPKLPRLDDIGPDVARRTTADGPDTDDAASTDGRSLRRQRNREAVIVALLELIREGNFDPATGEIADRAGVSHRSVFRYFDDLGDLVRTAIDHEIAAVTPLAHLHDVGDGPFDSRVDALIDSRLNIYNRTHGVGRVARARALVIPEIDEGMATIVQLFRDQLQVQFAPELACVEPAATADLLDAMMFTVSFESFDVLRRRLDRDDETIRRVWRIGLTALLKP